MTKKIKLVEHWQRSTTTTPSPTTKRAMLSMCQDSKEIWINAKFAFKIIRVEGCCSGFGVDAETQDEIHVEYSGTLGSIGKARGRGRCIK
jgi:hypothetical protein